MAKRQSIASWFPSVKGVVKGTVTLAVVALVANSVVPAKFRQYLKIA